MPFALIFIGVIMLVTAANNTHVQFAQQFATDGAAFSKYAIAVGAVGAAGYIPDLQGLSRAFMALVLISLVLSNSKSGTGLIGNFMTAINGIGNDTFASRFFFNSATPNTVASGVTAVAPN